MAEHRQILLWFYAGTIALFSVLGERFASQDWQPDKRHLLNVYFVKVGWAWTSLPLVFFIPLSTDLLGQRLGWQSSRTRALMVSSWRKLLYASLYWFLITQWFFGPSLLDRLFHAWPWAECEDGASTSFHACKAAGFRWISFDISGHCFLMVHSSLLIWEELVPFRQLLMANTQQLWSGQVSVLSRTGAFMAVSFVLVSILFLWYYMLILTSIFFHSASEKVLGTALGFLFWYLWHR